MAVQFQLSLSYEDFVGAREISRDPITRHDNDDRGMGKVAEFAPDLILSSETAGEGRLPGRLNNLLEYDS